MRRAFYHYAPVALCCAELLKVAKLKASGRLSTKDNRMLQVENDLFVLTKFTKKSW